jgi:hypothetical protein
MPQIEPIVIVTNKAGTTNVSTNELSLDPLGSKDGLTSYTGGVKSTDTVTTIEVGPPTAPALQSTLTISLNRPSKTSRISKVRVKLVMPVAALDVEGNPTTVKSHENSADVTYLFSEKSTQDERQDLDVMFRAILDDAPCYAVIQQLKSMY